MKKTFLLTAALALAASLTLSCDKNNPDDGGTTTDVVFDEPAFADNALSITFKDVTEPLDLGDELVLPEKLVFTEGGTFLFIGKKFEKALSAKYSRAGRFTVSDKVYNAPGLGKISVLGSKVNIVPPSGSGKDYDATVTPAKTPTSQAEINLVRSWKPSGKVKVSIPSKGVSTSLEPDLGKMAEYFSQHGFNVKAEDYQGYGISTIDISLADKAFTFTFTNYVPYWGMWEWVDQNAGKFKSDFSVLISELLNGSFIGVVTFYKSGGKNMADLTLEVSVNNESKAELSFTLVEA